ncbi:hypothetical protein [Nocardia sp. NPDC057030]|uniref:hypothetical protein n=1 Tax=unclassified Nocardia TaxID=2637762 RepID=UPI00363D5B1C
MADLRRTGVVVFAAVLLTVGCGTTDEKPPTTSTTSPQPDTELLNSNVWSADPGVDLFSRGAELVRAAVEAGDITLFAGIGASFPGYAAAINGPRQVGDDAIDSGFVSDSKTLPQSKRTEYLHITSYAEEGRTVSANVCRFYLRAEPVPGAESNDHTFCEGVMLENSSADAGTSGQRDESVSDHAAQARRLPTWNVFGTWKIKKLKLLSFADIPDSCIEWWRQQFPMLTQIGITKSFAASPDSPPPIKPVAVQYPEWIAQR